MPLLVGGIYKGEKARHTVEKLCRALPEHVTSSVHTIENSTHGVKIVAGCEDYESPQELIVPLENSSSVLVGRLFSKDFEKHDPKKLDIQAIKDSQGKYLGNNYWGRYILVCSDEQGVSIYRDPQGLATLFYMPIEGGYIFASSVSLLYDALDKKPDLNWNYLASFVASNHSVTTVTPFLQVQEVLPGCSVTLGAGREPTISQFWDPTTYTTPYKEDDTSFEERLYDTVRQSINAWTKGCTHVKNELSGGLDSSSLLAIMKSDDPHRVMSAYNMYHSTIASSDEREFAQDVAARYEVPLSFLDISQHLPFDQASIDLRFDRPQAGKIGTQLPHQLELDSLEERISGQGGDHLFFAGAPLEMVLDYYYESGLGGISAKMHDVAAFHRMPFFKILQKVLRLYVQHKRGSLNFLELVNMNQPWMKDLFKDCVDVTMFKPYFWESLHSVPPGKAQQILSILSATLYIDHGQLLGRKNTLYPLLSQPVVELALSIPSHKSLSNGYDRYIYREAMQRRTEGKFIWRKTKGEVSGAAILGLRKNFERVRNLLLEGHFVRLGYVDRENLERTLLQVKHGNIEPLWPILNLYVVEQWLASWNLQKK